MKKRISFILFSLSILLQSCVPYNSFVASRLISNGESSFSSPIEIISYEEKAGVIVVKARVNDSDEFSFILDSGAAYTIVSKEVADILQLNPKAFIQMSDFSGLKNRMDIVVLDSIVISGVQFSNIAAGIVDFENNPIYSCIANGGIIGANLMHLCNWEIDFPNKKVKMMNATHSIELLEESIAIPFQTYTNIYRPYIDIETEYFKLSNCLFDIGSASGLTVPVGFCNMDSVFAERPVNVLYGEANEGIYGSKADTVFFFNSDTLKFNSGDYLLNPTIKVMRHTGLTMGNGLLNNSVVSIDYHNKQIVINNPTVSRTHEIPNYGLSLELKEDKVYIDAIYKNSVAEKAGLKVGDVVYEVNEQKVNVFYTNYCEFFEWKKDLLNNSVEMKISTHNNIYILKRRCRVQ